MDNALKSKICWFLKKLFIVICIWPTCNSYVIGWQYMIRVNKIKRKKVIDHHKIGIGLNWISYTFFCLRLWKHLDHSCGFKCARVYLVEPGVDYVLSYFMYDVREHSMVYYTQPWEGHGQSEQVRSTAKPSAFNHPICGRPPFCSSWSPTVLFLKNIPHFESYSSRRK